MTDAEIQDFIGSVLASWRVTSVLGKGGMGVVFHATHLHLERQAAVKVLFRELSSDRALLSRFFDEARAAARIDHPGITKIFDCGLHEGSLPFIVMEALKGQSLAAFLDREPLLDIRQGVRLAQEIAEIIAATHQEGIVHRDLKPDNIFVVDDQPQRVKVLDFGLAKLQKPPVPDAAGLTVSGILMGTPRYMAPEQCRSASAADARSDIYSFGCVIFEMFAGHPPFSHDSFAMLVAAHVSEAPARLSQLRRDVPPGLDHLVDTMLAKDPRMRPQTMEEVGRLLSAYDEPEQPVAPPATTLKVRSRNSPLIAVLAGATALGSAAVLWSTLRIQRPQPTFSQGAMVSMTSDFSVDAAANVAIAATNNAVSVPVHAAQVARVESMVTIETLPTGARVCRLSGGTSLGSTPLRVPLKSLPALAIQKAGYEVAYALASKPKRDRVFLTLHRLGPDDVQELICKPTTHKQTTVR